MTERTEWERDVPDAPDVRGAATSSEGASLVRHEEELRPGTATEQVGSVRVRKHVETYPVEKLVERHSEQVDEVGQRVPAVEGDSGQIETLEDGSVSIPVFEEELVVTKRVVVRERLIVRKTTVTDEHRIEAELRKERVEVDADAGVELNEVADAASSSGSGRAGGAPPVAAREHPARPEQTQHGFEEGMDRKPDSAPEQAVGRFSRGQDHQTETTEEEVDPRFSRGQERPGSAPEKEHEGRFSEGQDHLP